MGDNKCDPRVIKKTQDTLGKIVKKPPLTEKLLGRPPLKFLHDIIVSVIKTTGFMQGLYSDSELENVKDKDKESKLAYMQKFIDIISLVNGEAYSAKSSKIIAGQEPEKTNELLQGLAKAINKKVNNEDYVNQVLKKDSKGSSSKDGDGERRKKDKSEDRDRDREKRHRSRDKREKKDEEKGDEKKEDKNKDEERERRHKERKERDRDHKSKDREHRSRDREDRDKDRERRHKDRDRSRGKDGDRDEDREKERERRRRERKEREREEESRKEEQGGDDDEESRKKGVKFSGKDEESGSRRKESNMNGTIGEDDLPPQVAAARRMARPSSARPAPPKPKKEDGIQQEPVVMGAPSGNVANIITDKGMDSDEDDTFMAKEEDAPPSPTPEHRPPQNDDEEGGDHGGLVKKMLETKQELEKGSQLQGAQPQKKTEIERSNVNDASKRKERQMIQKDIEKLRGSIQTLTRSVNPLGKIMDFVQEDLDSMQKELDTWKQEHKLNAVALQREQAITENCVEPLKAQLTEIEAAISDQLDLIAAVKSNVLKNDDKISKMLSSVTKS